MEPEFCLSWSSSVWFPCVYECGIPHIESIVMFNHILYFKEYNESLKLQRNKEKKNLHKLLYKRNTLFIIKPVVVDIEQELRELTSKIFNTHCVSLSIYVLIMWLSLLLLARRDHNIHTPRESSCQKIIVKNLNYKMNEEKCRESRSNPLKRNFPIRKWRAAWMDIKYLIQKVNEKKKEWNLV